MTESPKIANKEIATRVLTVQNKMGVHARPAAMIVRTANKYEGVELIIEKDEEQVNGKSIMGVMMLAAGCGSELRFIASGKEGHRLLDELDSLFIRKFEEV